jgi:hypothetical protein
MKTFDELVDALATETGGNLSGSDMWHDPLGPFHYVGTVITLHCHRMGLEPRGTLVTSGHPLVGGDATWVLTLDPDEQARRRERINGASRLVDLGDGIIARQVAPG